MNNQIDCVRCKGKGKVWDYILIYDDNNLIYFLFFYFLLYIITKVLGILFYFLSENVWELYLFGFLYHLIIGFYIVIKIFALSIEKCTCDFYLIVFYFFVAILYSILLKFIFPFFLFGILFYFITGILVIHNIVFFCLGGPFLYKIQKDTWKETANIIFIILLCIFGFINIIIGKNLITKNGLLDNIYYAGILGGNIGLFINLFEFKFRECPLCKGEKIISKERYNKLQRCKICIKYCGYGKDKFAQSFSYKLGFCKECKGKGWD